MSNNRFIFNTDDVGVYENIISFMKVSIASGIQLKVYGGDDNSIICECGDEYRTPSEEDFIISISKNENSGEYESDKTFEEIEQAAIDGKILWLSKNPSSALLPDKFENDFIEFTDVEWNGFCYVGRTIRIHRDDTVTIDTAGLSTVKIELRNTGGNKYESGMDNIPIKIQELRDQNIPVEIIADQQSYPYVSGSQLDVAFGRIDPFTGEYVLFTANRTDTFTRSTRPVLRVV